MLDHGLGLETFCAKKIFEYQKTENVPNSHVDFPLPNSAEIARSVSEAQLQINLEKFLKQQKESNVD
jgi:hypothetical protein